MTSHTVPTKSLSDKPRIGLVRFPGSNCDADCIDALERAFGVSPHQMWHTDTTLPRLDGIILPGGFSFGDYLRSGALASHAPIMAEVRRFADQGGPVIGICNGFQVLTESGLLPGALLRNTHRQFVCRQSRLLRVRGESVYQRITPERVTITLPIAHGEGRYYAGTEDLQKLEAEGLVAFRYCDDDGAVTDSANPNGALNNIAGIVSANGRVMGLMPHPERAIDCLNGGVDGTDDGLLVWKAFLDICGRS